MLNPSLALAAAAITTALAGCATTGGKVPRLAELLAGHTGQNGRACVQTRDIRSYGVLEQNIISIDASHGYYLATVLPGCMDLATSIGVMFEGDFLEVCGQSMDRVLTGDGTCTIGQMYRFEDRDAAFATFSEVQQQRQALKQAAQKSE